MELGGPVAAGRSAAPEAGTALYVSLATLRWYRQDEIDGPELIFMLAFAGL